MKMNTTNEQLQEPNADEFQSMIASSSSRPLLKYAKTGKKSFDRKMKLAPSLKDEGNFTQVSNHLILNPNLTAEEKELILVYLMHKNGFQLTIESFCEDLHLKPRQVIIRLKSLIEKGFFALDDKYFKLIIPKIDNPKHKLKADKPEPDDTKSCVTTQVLPGENALDDTEMCVTTQVIPGISLEPQGIAEAENTNNKTGSDERTTPWGARTSDNTIKDSEKSNSGTSSSVGRNPVVVAPTGSPAINPNNFFHNIESALAPTETNRRAPLDGAPIVSEFWTGEDTTNLNYRWYKIELDRNRNFKYTFAQFEEILALALVFYLSKNAIEIPTSNKSLQKYSKHIGKLNQDSSHINSDDVQHALNLYESEEQDKKAFREDIFTIWKLTLPGLPNVHPPAEPIARQLPVIIAANVNQI
jgi:hypothetical protein